MSAVAAVPRGNTAPRSVVDPGVDLPATSERERQHAFREHVVP